MREPGEPRPNPWFHAPGDAAGVGRPALPDPGALTTLVSALAAAQPEATEHLVTAAHEMVLAVKTMVDAAEAALAVQVAAMAAAREAAVDPPVPRPAAPTEAQARPAPPADIGGRVGGESGDLDADDRDSVSDPLASAPRDRDRWSGSRRVRRIDIA